MASETIDEEVFNMSLRKFLKKVGVTSQRDIEQAVRTAIAEGRIKPGEPLSATVQLQISSADLDETIEGTIDTA